MIFPITPLFAKYLSKGVYKQPMYTLFIINAKMNTFPIIAGRFLLLD